MALKTKTDLLTMDVSFQGQPFVQVAAKSGITFDGLDISFQGQPFFGVVDGGGDTPTVILFRRNFESVVQRIGTRVAI